MENPKITRALGSVVGRLWRRLIRPQRPFSTSQDYWITRYNAGGNSGDGSYNQLAAFKAETLNDFVTKAKIRQVIEYGCGDGNQLALSKYPSYLGFDVSGRALTLCKNAFAGDETKSFRHMSEYKGDRAELTLSLDVIYHLVEDDVFLDYMKRLFDSADRYVVIYSSNTDENRPNQEAHVRHREFSRWVDEARPSWKLRMRIPNRYPFDCRTGRGSFADFYIYEKA